LYRAGDKLLPIFRTYSGAFWEEREAGVHARVAAYSLQTIKCLGGITKTESRSSRLSRVYGLEAANRYGREEEALEEASVNIYLGLEGACL